MSSPHLNGISDNSVFMSAGLQLNVRFASIADATLATKSDVAAKRTAGGARCGLVLQLIRNGQARPLVIPSHCSHLPASGSVYELRCDHAPRLKQDAIRRP